MNPEKKQLLDQIFGIDMKYIDPVVWYVYNIETGGIDDFRDEIRYKVHIDRFLELGANQTNTVAVANEFLYELKAKSGTITFFEVPDQSLIFPVDAVDELAVFFDLETNPMREFIAVKIVFQ